MEDELAVQDIEGGDEFVGVEDVEGGEEGLGGFLVGGEQGEQGVGRGG